MSEAQLPRFSDTSNAPLYALRVDVRVRDYKYPTVTTMFRISILHPDFTWHRIPTIAEQQQRLEKCQKTPQLRPLKPRWFRILVGHLLARLVRVSIYYCQWYGIQFSGQVCDLPFGLVLKRSDGTRLEEVVAMRAARDAGLPVPAVVLYGEYPERTHAPVSILMTRMPGEELFEELWDWYRPEQKQALLDQLRSFLGVIRSWKQDSQRTTTADNTPPGAISSILGTSIRSLRVPGNTVGPCVDEKDFNKTLSRCAYTEHTRSTVKDHSDWIEKLHAFEKLPENDIVFTHGDLAPYNLLVLPDGRISAFIDWEASGWFPAYWEYTTAFGRWPSDSWWYKIVTSIGGEQYLKHHEGDRARRVLAPDTMGW